MRTFNSRLLAKYDDIKHAYTTRLNGCTAFGNNLAYHVNDNPDYVDKNHKTLSKHMNYSLNRLVHMNQIHKDNIYIVDKTHDYANIPACDALITKEKKVPLMVMVADCIPILVYDPVNKIIAAVHAGRAGVFSEIIPKTINKMKNAFKSDPKHLLVSFGPSIQQCCYEVGYEIKIEAEKLDYTYAIKTENDNYYLDLIAIANQQLDKSGIQRNNIENSLYCTACNTDTFYSHRAERGKCGRFAGVIMLN